jgi:type IV pilus assembly protein PilC
MPIFTYEATDKEGKVVKGEISASDKKEVMNFLFSKGLAPILIKLVPQKIKKERRLWPFSGFSLLEKADFAGRLSALLKAGISVSRGFDILEKGAEKPKIKKLYSDLKTNIEQGRSFHEVLEEKYKRFFPRHFIGLVRAGEASGNLDEILHELSVDFRKEYSLRRKIQSASFYPIILLTGAVLIIIFLIVYIIPKLVYAFVESGVKLPQITLFLISFSRFIQTNYIFILLAILFLILMCYLFKKTKKGELFFANFFLSLPLLGDLSKKLILTRFCRTLSMLLRSGLVISEALDITADAVGNSAYKEAILNSRELVIKGISLSSTLRDYKKYFPSMVVETIAIGEEAGKLSEMLSTLSNFYEEESMRKSETVVSIIEPVLLVIMGMIVFFIALSVILPIYQFVSAF